MLDRGGIEGCTEFLKPGFARRPVIAQHPHLDQFMIVQSQVDFVQHCLTEAGLAGDDDGFEGVGLGAELLLQIGFQTVFLLCLIKGLYRQWREVAVANGG